MTDAEFLRARRVLMRRDPRLGAVIKRFDGWRPVPRRLDHFTALVRIITGQQLSTKAAQTIYERVVACCDGGGPTPAGLASVTAARLRRAGLSRQKIAYLRDLCARVADGTLPLDALESLTDDEVIAAVTRVKGLGRWSAEMFLMFRLHRPDVMPVGDLGIVKAIQRCYGLRKAPSAARMLAIAEAWRPYRTVACEYLWKSLEAAPV